MNLAELRRKAQKEKKEDGVPPPVSFDEPDSWDEVPVLAGTETEIETVIEMEPALELEQGVFDTPLPVPGPGSACLPAETQVEAVKTARTVSKAFDPLALLLAGRAAALVDEIAFAD